MALGNNGASTERDILSMSSRIAGAAKVVGMTEADLLGVANAVSSVGIEAEAGGTAISNVLIDMSKAVKTGSDDLERFARVAGISADDFARAFSESPADAMNLFVKGLGRIQQTGGDVFTVLDDLGQSDVRVTSALLKMAGAGDLLTQSLKDGEQAWSANSALQAEYAKRAETTAAKIQVARNNIRDAAITLGDALTPGIAAVSEGIASIATGIANLPAPVRDAGLAITGIGSAGILAAAGVAKVVSVGQDFSRAIDHISSKSPRAAAGIGKMRGAAVEAGKAFAAVAVAGAALSALEGGGGEFGYEQIAKSMTEGADAARVLNEWIAKTNTSLLGIEGPVTSIDALMKTAFDPDVLSQAASKGDAFVKTISLGMVDLTSDVDDVNRQFQNVDSVLSQMASGGNADGAARMYEMLATKAREAGASTEDLAKRFPQYAEALAAVTNQQKQVGSSASGATAGVDDFGASVNDSARSAEDAQQAISDLAQSVSDLGAQLLGQRGSARDFEAAIDDATAALKENGKTLNTHTEAGRANEAALDRIASSTVEWAAKSAEAGASASELAGILDRGRKAFLDFADDADMSAGEANKLADSMGLIPDEVDTLFTAAGVAESQKATEDLISTYFGAPKRVSTIFDTPGSVASQEQAATTTHFYQMVPDEVVTPFSTPGAAESAKAAWGVESNIRSIPKSWSSQITVSGADAAANAAWRVKAALDAIPRRVGSSVIVSSISHNIPRERGALMQGGVSAYAGGGISLATGQAVPRVPQIAKGGTYALWAERKTGWEAYISGLPAERDRNVRIWRDAGKLLGMPDWLLAAATARQYAAGELQGRYASQQAYAAAQAHGVAVDQRPSPVSVGAEVRAALVGLHVEVDGHRFGKIVATAGRAMRR